MRIIKRLLRKIAGGSRTIPAVHTGPHFPAGHFYSPVIDQNFVAKYKDSLWSNSTISSGNELGLDPVGHQTLLRTAFKQYLVDFDYPQTGTPSKGFIQSNGMFSGLDSRALFAMLRHFQPRNIIEVGSGYSSLITLDVNKRFLQNRATINLIEPYPPEFLEKALVNSHAKLHRLPVQDISMELFESLQENDILFIDSSHVCKTGSDVNHIFFNILPKLAPGVIVHFHDIFLPDEYPQDWVFKENRSWNEQYLLRAFLMFNTQFKVLFGCHYAATRLAEDVRAACGSSCGGGSIWLQRSTVPR